MATDTDYTNGNGDQDAQVAANFTAGVPVDTETIGYTNAEGDLTGATLPNNWPGSETFGLEITAAYECPVEDFITDQNTHSTILVNHADAVIDLNTDFTTATITAGEADVDGNDPTGDVVLNGGLLAFIGEGDTLTGNVTDTAAGTLYASNQNTVDGDITLTASDLKLDGACELICTGTITHSTAGQIVTVDGGGAADRTIVGNVSLGAGGTLDWSLNAGDDLTIDGDVVIAGTWTGDPGNHLIVTGDLDYQNATAQTNVHVTMTGTGNLNGTETSHQPESLTFASGSSYTLTGTYANAEKIVIEAGASVAPTTTQYLYLYRPDLDDFLDILGTCTAGINVRGSGDKSNSGTVATTGEVQYQSSDDTLTQTGPVNVGSLRVLADANDAYGHLTLSNASVDLGDVVLAGDFSATTTGRLTFSGAGSFTTGSLNRDPGFASTGNQLNLGPRNWTIEAGSTIDGTGITCTADGGNVILAYGSTISNCVFDNPVYVKNGVPGSGNTNVFFLASGSTAGAGPDGVGVMGRIV